MEIELEKTYLIKELPDLSGCDFVEILDIYIPEEYDHPKLRIRKRGDIFEITKKFPIEDSDASEQREYTIKISKEEFEELSKIKGKRLRKIRYYYPVDGRTAEIDVFQDDLSGLILVEFEFNSKSNKDTFNIPSFCLADITNDDFIAGGILAGKKYLDVEPILNKYNYKKIIN